MLSYIFTPSVLLLLNTVCESAHPVVKVEFDGTAVLPCSGRCSGVVRWSMFSKSSEVLAECDQTSCRSVKEGYQMIHNQYLQGDPSLIITEADFSRRGLYTCDCDDTDLCDVQLQIEPLKTTLHMKVGDSLLLKVDVTDRVEVIYSSTGAAGASSGQICTVEKHSLWSTDKYTHRVSLSSVLELKGMKESDSGNYTVRDTLNDEIIRIYTVTVQGDSEAHGLEQKPSGPNSSVSLDCQGAALSGWAVAVLVVLGVVCAVSVVVNVVHCSKSRRLQGESVRNRDAAQTLQEQHHLV